MWRHGLVEYRVPISATLMIVALASMFVLTSQSGSSFATYVLAVYVFAGAKRWRALFLDWGFLLSCALLLYIPLTSLWSTPWDARDAFGQMIRATLVFAFLVSIAECMQVDWFRQRMTLALTIIAALAALAAMWVFFADPPEEGRLNGLGQLDTHVMAGMVYAVAALAGTAWLLTAQPMRAAAWGGRAAKWGVRAAVVVLILAILLTASRNAIAACALALICLLLTHWIGSAGRYLVVAALCALALGGALAATYFFVPGADAHILPRGDSFRLGIWADYLGRIASDGPWFGMGVLTDDSTEVEGWPVLHPHNLYLAVAWQGGLFGVGLMLALVAATLRTLLGHYAAAEAKLALAIWALALPAYLIDGYELVDKIGWTWLLFWLPVAIGQGLRGRAVLEDARRFGTQATAFGLR